MKTIQERVDVLLREGAKNPEKWMKAHGYKEPDTDAVTTFDECCDFWQREWKRLRDHHLDETLFLFDVIEELASRLNEKN